MSRHPHNRGFTLLEFLLVITLVGIFFVVAIENLLPLTGEAERVSVERNRVAMDSNLRTAAAERLLRDGREAVKAMEGRNPVEWLQRPPTNYLGEKPGANPANVPPGHWYWDPEGQWLIYTVRHSRYFHSELDGPPRIRFQVEREGGEQFFALRLVSPDAYHWDSEGSELARWILRGRPDESGPQNAHEMDTR
ncbi:type II secretion system protein [Natronospira bacteriovora]|uniref:Type II secretion system protein n=1 Tax=Natronospira bacteriovora TaxID=3069753 RepID=A0ABU0W784_9GAMM|nr:type II secretion system protein [Natronospira sp. AB-CW4]MDQ2069882.1 type II secretion system protein [Natronospira sp. AB-CW4]